MANKHPSSDHPKTESWLAKLLPERLLPEWVSTYDIARLPADIIAGLVVGKAFGETGLGGFVAEVALVPVLLVLGGGSAALAGAAVALPMLVKRVMGNGRPAIPGRVPYVTRLLFDRDPR